MKPSPLNLEKCLVIILMIVAITTNVCLAQKPIETRRNQLVHLLKQHPLHDKLWLKLQWMICEQELTLGNLDHVYSRAKAASRVADSLHESGFKKAFLCLIPQFTKGTVTSIKLVGHNPGRKDYMNPTRRLPIHSNESPSENRDSVLGKIIQPVFGLTDSLNEAEIREVLQIEAEYLRSLSQKQIHILEAMNKIQRSRVEQVESNHSLMLVALTALALLVLIILIGYAFTRRLNRKLRSQNSLIEEQKEELTTQNEKLIQSQEQIAIQRDLLSRQNEILEEQVTRRTSELVEYNYKLEQFAFIIAHNLRAPVARVLGLGLLLKLDEVDAIEREEIIQRIMTSVEELDLVVTDLNQILEVRSNPPSLAEVELSRELESVCKLLESEVQNSNALLECDLSAVKTVKAFKPYLGNVLYNLLENAIRYRHPDRIPVIQVKANQYEDETTISITDNGIGIDLDRFRQKVFMLYQRFHLELSGKGMGLFMAQTQMSAMGGRLEVESKPNGGSTFRIIFKS